VIRIYHIHKDGWTIIHDALDVDQLHYKFDKEKNLEGDGDEIKGELIWERERNICSGVYKKYIVFSFDSIQTGVIKYVFSI